MNRNIFYGFLMAFMLFSGCGSDKGDDSVFHITNTTENNISDNMEKGYFPNVSGVNYITSSGTKGILDDKGMFIYQKNDNIDFFIKDIHLGTIKSKKEISVFSFKNPKLVAQTLYSLDNDLNPSNGLQIDVKNTKGSNKLEKIRVYSKLIKLDTLSENSEEYKNLIKEYGGDLINFSDEAVLNELYKIIYNATTKDKRVYKYLLGEYYIAPSSKYYANSIVSESQQDIETRIKRYVYTNNFIIKRSALAYNFSNKVSVIDDNYNAYNQVIAEQIKEFTAVSSALAGVIKGSKNDVLMAGIKYAIDEKVDFEKAKLGEGTGSDALGAAGALLKDCALSASLSNGFQQENGDTNLKAVADCLTTASSESAQLYFKAALKESPIFSHAAIGLTKVAEDTAKIALTCESVFKKNKKSDENLADAINCVSKVASTGYKYINQTIASSIGLFSIAKSKKDFYSKDAAFALLEDLSYIGEYSKIDDFLHTSGASLDTLLRAEHERNHKGESFDLTIAHDAYNELLFQWNKEIKNFKIKYTKLLKKDKGKVVGVVDSVNKNYYGEVAILNIDYVQIRENKSEGSHYLEMCYSIKNNGVRDIDIFGKTIEVSSESGTNIISISDIHNTLTMGQPLNKKQYCNRYLLIDYDVLTFKKNFIVTVDFDAKIHPNNIAVVNNNTQKIQGYSVYEGIDIPFISPISVGIYADKSDTDTEGIKYNLSADIHNIDYEKEYYYKWIANGATIKSSDKVEYQGKDTARYIWINMPKNEKKANIQLQVFDSFKNILAETSINIRNETTQKIEPLLLNDIYKLVESGKEFIIKPIVIGGEKPYSINFDTSGIDDLEIVEKKEDSIVVKINSSETLKDYIINYTVVDDLGEKKSAKAIITVSSSSLVPLSEDTFPVVDEADTPTPTPSTPISNQNRISNEYMKNHKTERLASTDCKAKNNKDWKDSKNDLISTLAPADNMMKSIEGCVVVTRLMEYGNLNFDKAVESVVRNRTKETSPFSDVWQDGRDGTSPVPSTPSPVPTTSTPTPSTPAPMIDSPFVPMSEDDFYPTTPTPSHSPIPSPIEPPNVKFSGTYWTATGKFVATDQSTSDSGICKWYWEWGDGSTDTIQNPTHYYTESGSYQVALTVTDCSASSNTSSASNPVFQIKLVDAVTDVDTSVDDYPSTHTAETKTLSTSLDGKIETKSDIDAFKIVVEKSGELTLYTTGSLDTLGVLYDSSGTELNRNDDDEDSNFKITYSATAGTYYLDVSAYDTATGSYTVHKQFLGYDFLDDLFGNDEEDNTVSSNKLTEIYDKWSDNGLIYGNSIVDFAQELGEVYGISVKNQYYDISAFEKVSGIKLSSDDSTDTECQDQSNKCYYSFSQSFLSVNPQILTWMLDNILTPSPKYNKIQEFYNNKGKEFFLPFVYAYKYIHENKNFNSEVNAYNAGINQNKSMPVYLRDKYEGESIDNTTPLHIGFWLRRGLDGSDQAVFYALKKILETYDSNLLNILLNPIENSTSDDYSSVHATETTTLSSSSAHSDMLNGKIEVEDDIDTFKIIIVDSGTLTLYTTGSLDTIGELYNSDGVLISENDDDGDGYNFKITYPVTRGVYFLDVGGFSRGDYTVHEEFEEENVPLENDNSDIVVDTETNLMWQDNSDVEYNRKVWLEKAPYDICKGDKTSPACFDTSGDTATTYCSNLVLGGYSDWRLPSINELKSIIDTTRNSQPYIKSDFKYVGINDIFNTSVYWSSDTDTDHPTYVSYAREVDFNMNSEKMVDSLEKWDLDFVRCVRTQ